MKIVIIGNVGQGKSALNEALMHQMSIVECTDSPVQQLLEKKEDIILEYEDAIMFKGDFNSKNKRKKKGKDIKEWERTKFYQR